MYFMKWKPAIAAKGSRLRRAAFHHVPVYSTCAHLSRGKAAHLSSLWVVFGFPPRRGGEIVHFLTAMRQPPAANRGPPPCFGQTSHAAAAPNALPLLRRWAGSNTGRGRAAAVYFTLSSGRAKTHTAGAAPLRRAGEACRFAAYVPLSRAGRLASR